MEMDAGHILHLKICQTCLFYKSVVVCILAFKVLILNWKSINSGEGILKKRSTA